MGRVFVDFYKNLFSYTSSSTGKDIFEAVHKQVPANLLPGLSLLFTRGENEISLKSMGLTKSPGPDGMPTLFYQRYWTIVGDDVSRLCLDVLNGDFRVDCFNHTFIALIPKIKAPTRVTEFRPISLCNVIYKIISKTIANRLKKVLPHAISEFRSAFIPNRMILDNVLAAFETIHCLWRRGKSGRKTVALKLDMVKAYDCVEWVFLEKMLILMGFPSRFVYLIMRCVTSVSYSVLLQGRPYGFISPSMGLRQGDSISPCLFLIVAEGFSSLLQQAERQGKIQRVAITPMTPSINHLFFADDSLLFCDRMSRKYRSCRIFSLFMRLPLVRRLIMISRPSVLVNQPLLSFKKKFSNFYKSQLSSAMNDRCFSPLRIVCGLMLIVGKGVCFHKWVTRS